MDPWAKSGLGGCRRARRIRNPPQIENLPHKSPATGRAGLNLAVTSAAATNEIACRARFFEAVAGIENKGLDWKSQSRRHLLACRLVRFMHRLPDVCGERLFKLALIDAC